MASGLGRTLASLFVAAALSSGANAQDVVTPTPQENRPAAAPGRNQDLTEKQPEPAPEPLPRGSPGDLADRLARLRPAEPEGYLKLGEEVAAWAEDSAGRELARKLLGLAFALDRQRAGQTTSPTATSACLALSELGSTPSERTWFLALARSIDRRLALPEWSSKRSEASDPTTAYLASLFVGLVRAGDTVRAQKVLAQPGVRELIKRNERLLSPIGDTGGLSNLEREMTRWPCPECAGKRIVRKYQSIPPQYRVCSVCNGTLGPRIIPEELAAQLRFESRILAGTARSWASEVLSDGGSPLRDVDPDELVKVLRLDPSRPLWREGRWLAANVQPVQAPPGEGGVREGVDGKK